MDGRGTGTKEVRSGRGVTCGARYDTGNSTSTVDSFHGMGINRFRDLLHQSSHKEDILSSMERFTLAVCPPAHTNPDHLPTHSLIHSLSPGQA